MPTNKKLLAITLALSTAAAAGASAATVAPTPAYAETTAETQPADVASIGNATYSSLQAAVDAVQNGETVMLLADADECVDINSGTFTLDLNGHSLGNGAVADYVIDVNGDARVTLKNGGEGGQIGWVGVLNEDGSASASGFSTVCVWNSASLTIEDGVTVTNALTDAVYNGRGTLTINGGSYTSDDFVAVYVGGGTTTINGGTFTSNTSDSAMEVDERYGTSANVTINGGTFVSDDRGSLTIGGGSTVTINGGTFTQSDHISDCIDLWEGSTLNINGGTIGSPFGKSSNAVFAQSGQSATVNITGGDINGEVNLYGTNLTSANPRLTLNNPSQSDNLNSNLYLYDCKFIKLRNLTLGYTIPESISSKIYASNIRFYVSGENLLTITPFKGLDPEMRAGQGYTTMRQLSFGVNVSF